TGRDRRDPGGRGADARQRPGGHGGGAPGSRRDRWWGRRVRIGGTANAVVRRRRYGRPSPVCGATLSDVDSPEASTPPSGRHGWDRRQITIAAVCAAVILAFGTVLTVGLMNRGVNDSINSAIAKGQRIAAPSFSDPVLTSAPGIPTAGQRLSLAQLRGHPVVLNIWASWCTPCIDEAPILQSIWDRYRARGVYV